ncbi:MAG: hypothetical protein WB561_00725 [Terracidiphilus sp.]
MEAALPAIVVGLVDEFKIDRGSVFQHRDDVKLEMACLKSGKAAPRVVGEVILLAEDNLRSMALEDPEVKVLPGLRSPYGRVALVGDLCHEVEVNAHDSAVLVWGFPDAGEILRAVDGLAEEEATVAGWCFASRPDADMV